MYGSKQAEPEIYNINIVENENINATALNNQNQANQIIEPEKTNCEDELDTRCWKTYRDEKMNFIIKLPSNFYIKRINSINDESSILSIRSTNKNYENDTFMAVGRIDCFKEENMSQYVSYSDIESFYNTLEIDDNILSKKIINSNTGIKWYGYRTKTVYENEVLFSFISKVNDKVTRVELFEKSNENNKVIEEIIFNILKNYKVI